MDTILVLDFGSQTSALIGRRVRELGVYSELLPGDFVFTQEYRASAAFAQVKGLILSGSPESVYAEGSPAPDPKIYELGLPLLGLCYGLQRMTFDHGGTVEALPVREYGGVQVQVDTSGAHSPELRRFLGAFDKRVPLADIVAGKGRALAGEMPAILSWMSHGDTLTRLAPGFVQYGASRSNYPAVLCNEDKRWFGLQFHPEVSHCERGLELLAGFVFGVCACKQEWSISRYLEDLKERVQNTVAGVPVLLLISGGVDSTALGALLLKTLDAELLHLVYMDTGLMRQDETKHVEAALKGLGAKHLHIIYCEDEFLAALTGLSDPEAKRKAIGDLFITIQNREVCRLGLPDSYYLAQGTLYTDLIESGKGVGKKAHLIKSHHNVGSPLVAAKRKAGRLIEPLDKLYKDEVRALGALLGLDETVINRHPFPGPGLAVRIIGEVSKEKCDILRRADAIYLSELKRRPAPPPSNKSLYDEIWQAFAVLLPIRSVGVAGDVRKYGWVLALRAVISSDGMTADVYPFPPADLLEIAGRITNQVPEIGRVTYDISSKPPATIEWE
ncbi:glutamine-hydrolyzing GMP synthase [Breznakiellaceae bacterium SP9]